MQLNTRSVSGVRRQWRQQILAHRNPTSLAARRGLVAIYFHHTINQRAPYVKLDDLSMFVAHEDQFHRNVPRLPHRDQLRLSVYRAKRVPHGVQWGGMTNSLLYKDMTLYPCYAARGLRLDIKAEQLLRISLELDRSLTWASRPPALRDVKLRLPRLWAGFYTNSTEGLRGAGPEFEFECGATGQPEEVIFRDSERQFDGLKLYPMEWVSHVIDLAGTIFAEMRGFPRRQVFRLERFPDDLMGYQGASEYDFYHSRHRRHPVTLQLDTYSDLNERRSSTPQCCVT